MVHACQYSSEQLLAISVASATLNHYEFIGFLVLHGYMQYCFVAASLHVYLYIYPLNYVTHTLLLQ